MSEFAFDREMASAPPPRRRNANLGSADGEEIFMAFDTRIVRRFGAFLKPHPNYLIGALVATVLSAFAQLALPVMIGQAVTAATTPHTPPGRIDLMVFEFG